MYSENESEALEDYKQRYSKGDEQIASIQKRYGKNYCVPVNITWVSKWDDGKTIYVHFKHQGHVASYSLEDGKLVFEGFEPC